MRILLVHSVHDPAPDSYFLYPLVFGLRNTGCGLVVIVLGEIISRSNLSISEIFLPFENVVLVNNLLL